MVAAHHLFLAREVSYLDVGGRRVEIPRHGHAVAVWKVDWETTSAPFLPEQARPRIAACRGDGTVLSELGPGDYVDHATLRPPGGTRCRA